MQLISFALTEAQVLDKHDPKTETRRLGWWLLKSGRRKVLPGDYLCGVRKAMGRKPGEPLVRLCVVEVLAVHRESLDAITADAVAREGFRGWAPAQFVEMFRQEMGCNASREVTVIRFRRVPTPEGMSIDAFVVQLDTEAKARKRNGEVRA